MPWNEVSVMDQRREFVRLALQEGANRRELCRFGISADVGYKWLARTAAGHDLADRSRRPHTSPKRSDAVTEARVLAVREVIHGRPVKNTEALANPQSLRLYERLPQLRD